MPQLLPSKERSLFQQVVKNYESKQYKKGIKAADQILRKVPDHGDTQAMKALILNAQNQSDEAFKLAKDALKSDMRSHICWHVYGLLYRSTKNFEESMKAYRMALRWEPDSQQIQRDLAMLQVQMRDFSGYVSSRTVMLQARPGWRANWTALAIAQHLNGDLEGAERTLTTYEDTLRSPPPKTDVEHQEAVLYKNHIIAEMGQFERALEHLDAASKRIADQQTVLELRATYLSRLNRKDEAAKVYRQLLERNSEYRAYYDGLEEALGFAQEDAGKRKALYEEYAEKNKRGDAALRIPLNFLAGAEFKQAVDIYLRRRLRRGVPSTFANLKALYVDKSKIETLIGLVNDYKDEKGADMTFTDGVHYFLAQHYDYHVTRDLAKASQAVEHLLEKDPKCVDYLMTKARICKHHGDLEHAAAVMENARELDEKDRYVNTKAAKYQLRNDQNDDALRNMSKFTKPDAPGGPLGDLTDMQSVWFMTEDGESRLRQNQIGLALKRFHAVLNFFDVWQEDQYDFHAFSLRKGQIRAYIQMLKWEDQLRSHPYYSRAAVGAIRTYLKLDASPELANGVTTNGSNADAGERKKAAKKARKEAEKQAQLEHERRDARKTAGVGADGEPKKIDPDPEGHELAATKQPLEDALKFLTPLLELNVGDMEVYKVGFEVSIRRRKWLPALRCIHSARKIDPSSPFIHSASIRFRAALDQTKQEIPAAVLATISREGTGPISDSTESLSDLNDSFLAAKTGFIEQVVGLDTRWHLNPKTALANVERLSQLINSRPLSFDEVMTGLEYVSSWKCDYSNYVAAAREQWPLSKILRS